MNERIKQLSKQAVDYASACEAEAWDWAYETKFAELIIRECIDRGNDLAKHYINNHSEQDQAFLLAAIADYSNEIEKHFGIE